MFGGEFMNIQNLQKLIKKHSLWIENINYQINNNSVIDVRPEASGYIEFLNMNFNEVDDIKTLKRINNLFLDLFNITDSIMEAKKKKHNQLVMLHTIRLKDDSEMILELLEELVKFKRQQVYQYRVENNKVISIY